MFICIITEKIVHENYWFIFLQIEIEDDKKNVLIVPEINQTIILLSKNFGIQKVLWWLSLDYFLFQNLLKHFLNF